jgi:hypothetical protein
MMARPDSCGEPPVLIAIKRDRPLWRRLAEQHDSGWISLLALRIEAAEALIEHLIAEIEALRLQGAAAAGAKEPNHD